jgi:hypothetical protein
MKRLNAGWICLLWLVHAVCADTASCQFFFKKAAPAPSANIPWQELDERATAAAQQMQDRPTMIAQGTSETFLCTPQQYYWLLDNPDRVVIAWRRLGAKCVNITRRGAGRFGYSDELGSDLSWETIHQSPTTRIWLAEGKVKVSPALPLVPVKALVVMHHTEGKSAEGATIMQHQAEVILHTDSRAASAMAKLMGQNATKVAEQGVGQLQMFFSALSSYVSRHPEQADALFNADNPQAIQQTQKIGQ